jgi:glutamine synthetase
VAEGYELPEPVEKDIFEMSEKERVEAGIASLPGSLEEAIRETEKSELVRETLGDHIFKALMANKQMEWDAFRTHVSKFELDRYLPVL